MKLLLSVLTTVLLLAGSNAVAAPKAKVAKGKQFFTLKDDGCEHPVTACDKVPKMNGKIVKQPKYSGVQDYLGSIQTQFADKNEAGIDSWDHYFSGAPSCEEARKKMLTECEAG